MRQIVEGGEPILLVTHDADEGMWQFLAGGDVASTDAMVVSLESMLNRDPCLGELADLAPGWQATRERTDSPWRRTMKVEIGRKYIFTRITNGIVERATFVRFDDGTAFVECGGDEVIWEEDEEAWQLALSDLHARGFH